MDNIKKLIDNNDVISFDMFDTLVLRLTDSPDTVFDIVGEWFGIRDYSETRKKMQNECSLELMKEKNYPHANMDEIYDYIKKESDLMNVDKIKEYELYLEEKLLYQNKEMYEIYRYAKDNKKRVIVTSDMYLEMDFIKKVLNNCGYNDIDKIYLSSESRKAKFNGELYDEVIEKEKVDPSKILHIGDNYKDDIKMALSKGINAYHYKNTKFVTKGNTITESIHNGIVRYIERSESDFWVKLGAKAGLMYQGLINNIEDKNYDTVNFLSRDGYNLYHLMNKINSSKKLQYIYTSRRALLLASITKLDDNALNNLPPFTMGQTIKEFLSYVGMEKIFSQEDLEKVGFNSLEDRIKTIDDINRFKKIYILREKEVLDVCKKERKNAFKYFEQFDIFNKKNLMFDCGWNGSSQYLLDNFITSEYKDTDIEFYYTGIFNTEKSKNQLHNRKYDTFLFDINKNEDIVNDIRSEVVILELFFSSPENSIIKYSDKGYEFDNFESNLEYKKKILEGLEKYIEISYPLFKELGININASEAINPLITLIKHPTQEEAINIGNIESVDAFAKQEGVKKYIANIDYETLKENPNIEIYWKYGLLARNDIDIKVKKIVCKKCNIESPKEKSRFAITGVNNPSLLIIDNTTDIIEAYENDEKISLNEKTIGNNHTYTAELNNDRSIVKIIKGTKTIKLRNSKIRRLIQKVFAKIGRILEKITNKISSKFSTFKRLVKYAWKNYHFIVPIGKLKELYRRRNNPLNLPIFEYEDQKEYLRWLKKNEIKEDYKEMEYNPLISFVIPVYNVKPKLLNKCIKSILKQSYKNFEICMADDCSTNKATVKALKKWEKHEKIKIVYRKENGHISKASNSALELVSGEFVALMDNDDVIPDNALYEVVKVLNKNKKLDLIYSDEDKLDFKGRRCNPHFKPDYSPDTLLSLNYFCHFTVLRTQIMREIGGFRPGYEGSQDHDLFLRFVEKTNNIYHIPKILYHWRQLKGSTSIGVSEKNYAIINGKRSIEDALKRRGLKGVVHIDKKSLYYYIEYKNYTKEPLVSIVIPTKDYANVLKRCVDSIINKSTYKNYEIIVVNNRSDHEETLRLFDEYKKKYNNFRVIDADMEFNYSKINNLAVKEAKGDYIVLLNNDTKIITNNWIELMLGYASLKHVGIVGAKLLYPDSTIQHGGVVLGMGGVAGHAFVNRNRNYQPNFGRLSVPYDYSAVTAACVMIEKKKFNEVNGLEEDLKVAYNDVDLCLKMLDKKYYNVFLPIVSLYHYESKSRGQEDTKEKKARLKNESDYMYKKWRPIIENDPFYNENLSRIQVFSLDRVKE